MYRKSLILTIAGLLLLSGSAVTLSAQDYVAPAVEISKEKVRIDGKIFLSHVVKEKQTLYSISKAYGVTIEELYACNSKLEEEGLKKNSILLIPYKDKKDKDNVRNDKKKNESRKESNRKEGESKEKALTGESDSDKNKAEGKAAATATEAPQAPEQKIHVVKWFEDINSIAAKYDVSVSDLIAANNLKNTNLKTRQKLVIPTPGSIADKDRTAASSGQTGTESADINNDSYMSKDSTNQAFRQAPFFPKTSINMTLLLPLQAKEGKASRHFMDFYSGSLLAMKHLKEEGVSLNVNVFDCSNEDMNDLKRDINSSDVIIGPVTQEDIDSLYRINAANVPVVSPLDPKTEDYARKYNKFIFAPTSHNKQYEDLCLWVSEDYVPENKVIVIFEKDGYKTNHHPTVFSNLQAKGIPYREFSYSILEGRGIQEKLEKEMTEESTNRVIIASESEAFVNDVVRNLNLITLNKKEVVLYASGKIRSYETITPEYLHNTNLHVSLSYGIDYDDSKTMRFLNEYRALFNTEPSQFAFQGYDVCKYFVETISRYGTFWLDCITDETVPMLQSSFRFDRTENGSFINNAIRRVVFEKNYVIKEMHKKEILIKEEEGISEALFD